jgi:hypothetical protein
MAADTEKIVAQSVTGLLEMMLMMISILYQILTEVVGPLARLRAACNNEYVVWFGSHLVLEHEMKGP